MGVMVQNKVARFYGSRCITLTARTLLSTHCWRGFWRHTSSPRPTSRS